MDEVKPDGSSGSGTNGKTRRHMGVCSNELLRKDLSSNGEHTVRCFVRASTFRLPKDKAKPIIMVGPGTGIAPMRAFLEERSEIISREGSGAAAGLGAATLFFGCRHENADYIYRDELKAHLASGALTSLHTAFSRDGKDKVYVQHLIKRESKAVHAMLNDGAHVYVCGGTRMGKDVKEAIADAVSAAAPMGLAKAREFVAALEKEGRYVQELWS